MATIDELERKILQLEEKLLEEKELTTATLSKANKAAEYAQHAYRVDHYGIIWVWDVETGQYRKTEMRVVSPKVADRAIESRNLADGAIEGRHMVDNLIEGRMIKNKTIEGRSIQNDAIGTDQIKDSSITGDNMASGALPNGKLADDAISTRNLQPKSVTAPKVADDVKVQIIRPMINAAVADLQNQIDSIEIGGKPISQHFGSDTHIGVSQNRLTSEFNRLWEKMEEVTGETLLDFTWQVTPVYFFGAPHSITVTAQPTNETEMFEHIALYLDSEEEPFYEEEDIYNFSHTFELTDTHLLRCKAQIMGREKQERQQNIIRYTEFFIGSGTTWEDMLLNDNFNPALSVQLGESMRATKDVTVADASDQHIFVVMGENMTAGFIRADLNGVEIPLTKAASTITVDGVVYRVYTSDNTYEAGTYNIDING